MKSIIKNVTFVDDTHSKIWANINTELDLVLNKIKALNEVIQPSNLAYISKDTLKAPLDKVDSNFDKGMNATNDNIKLLNKKIEQELYPPEWRETALSGAEGFTISLIRNAVVDPFIFLGDILTADGTTVTKDVATRLLLDRLEEWLEKHTFNEDTYQTGSQIGGFTSGMMQICEAISGQFMIDIGLGGETLGTVLMSTGVGVVVGGAIDAVSWSLVLEGSGMLAMGVLGVGSSFDEGTTPKDEHKEELKELQDVDTNIDPVNGGVGNPVKVEGKGSTGRVTPNDLNEQMAMHEVQSNPLQGATEIPVTIADKRCPASEGWVKMQRVVTISNGNKVTGVFDDFKYK